MITLAVKPLFQEYKETLAHISDSLNMKEAMRSDRKGLEKARDDAVMLKMALTESLSYFAIVLSFITFTALTPQAIENINDFLVILHVPFQLPVTLSSIVTVIILAFILAFGFFSYRSGLARRMNEIAGLYSPTNLLLYVKLEDIEKKIDELQEKR